MYVRIRRVYRLAQILKCTPHTEEPSKNTFGGNLRAEAESLEPNVRDHRTVSAYAYKLQF